MREPRKEAFGINAEAYVASGAVDDEIGHGTSILSVPMRTLYGYRTSPWTERACWALDHHAVSYRYHEHVPFLGEVLLRLKSGSLGNKRASVPLLVDDTAVFASSDRIARHADTVGTASKLFPLGPDGSDPVQPFVMLADAIADVGRANVTTRLLADEAARRESLPSFLPSVLRPVLSPTVALATKFLIAKYDVPRDVDAVVEQRLLPALETLRQALRGNDYLLGSFSFADVVVASALRSVRPERGAPMGPATRAAWTMESVASRFADVFQWRDAIYEKHR